MTAGAAGHPSSLYPDPMDVLLLPALPFSLLLVPLLVRVRVAPPHRPRVRPVALLVEPLVLVRVSALVQLVVHVPPREAQRARRVFVVAAPRARVQAGTLLRVVGYPPVAGVAAVALAPATLAAPANVLAAVAFGVGLRVHRADGTPLLVGVDVALVCLPVHLVVVRVLAGAGHLRAVAHF